MKLSYKALLYSALIYPGGGHFLLKHHAKGFLFAAIATACVCALIVRAIEIAQSISERILSGEIPFDIGLIRAEISLQALSAGSPAVTVASWLLAVCWVIAGVDAFRLGRRRERAGRSENAN